MGSGWARWVSAGDAAGDRLGPALVDLAHRVVADAVGPGTGVNAVEPVQVGTEHAVVHLVVDRAPHHLLLKVADARAAPAVDLQRTATVMGWAGSAGAPVPAVLAAAGPGPHGAPQYLLSEYIQGLQWRQVCPRLPAEQVAGVHRAIAEALLAVQSVRLAAFGELGPTGRPDTGGPDTGRPDTGRPDTGGPDTGRPGTGGVVAALRRRAALRIADEARRAVFLEVLDRDSGLFAVPAVPTLCHDDLHHANVLVRPAAGGWELGALLDWDKAWAGPAESDVARMAFWDDMTGPAFWSAYRAAVPRTPGADRRELVHQLLWCLEYDQDTPRHRDDTAAVCHQLDVRPPRPPATRTS